MLSDERFSSKAKVDRYGRRLPKDSGKKELERLYRVEDVEDVEGEDKEVDSDRVVEKELQRVDGKYDPARDGGYSESASEESSSNEEEELEEIEEEELTGFADQDDEGGTGVLAGKVSSRIAIVNLDWDNIRAMDLMAVFRSFVPEAGQIVKVSVYPSEFGKERMEREEIEGPPKDIFAKNGLAHSEMVPLASDEDEEDEREGEEEQEDEDIKKYILKEDQGEEFDSAKLRRYQLERLRYYYAVLTCSSESVAEAIYNAIDGTEYLTTANFFDLRFIPDEMDFSDDKPRDVCDKIPDGYRPNEFVTDALQHSKVRLTWDADDGARKEVQKRAFSGSRADIDENDLKAYLGSDSSDNDASEPEVVDSTITIVNDTPETGKKPFESKISKKDFERQRMRALLGLGAEPAPHSESRNEKAPVGDMQITFSSGLSATAKKGSIFENQPEPEESTVERYVRKEKERKARRKERTRANRKGAEDHQVAGATNDGDRVDNEEDVNELGFEDPFFTAPADDQAAATALRKEQKRQKRAERAAADAMSSAQRAELELLMVDDDDAQTNDPNSTSRSKMNHFDINEIAKAEKVLRKKKRKGKLSAREKEALEAKESDVFEMDVQDPRFGAVFERAEFAVDPSHPRFKGTEGMKMLLEEGRRKRRRAEVEGEDVPNEKGKKVRAAETVNGEDIKKLVERVKGKTKSKA